MFLFEFFARVLNLAPVLGTSKNLLNTTTIPYKNNSNIEGNSFGKNVFTDLNGYRIPSKNFSYKNDKQNLLILGDSVSFASGVLEEESFIGLLRKKNENINILNTSVVGYNIKSYQQILSEISKKKLAQKVILFYCLNDIGVKINTIDKKSILNDQVDKFSFINRLKESTVFSYLNNFLRSKSVLYIFVKSVLSKPSERHFRYELALYSNNMFLKELENNIKNINEIKKKFNLDLSFVVLPFEYQTRKGNCQKYLDPQEKLINFLNSYNLKYFDYTSEFCLQDKPKDLYLKYDPVHLSKKGHRLVFKLLNRDFYLEN